jgi:hypothetical protein
MSPPLPTDTELLKRLTDVHCHPTDTDEPARSKEMALCPINVCAMSTNPHDQGKVRQLALDFPTKVTPCFGNIRFLASSNEQWIIASKATIPGFRTGSS